MDGKIRASTGIPSRIVTAALMALFLLLSQRGVAANHKSHMINGTDAGKNGNLDELYHPNRVLVTFKATAYSAVGGGDRSWHPPPRARGEEGCWRGLGSAYG